MNVIAFDNGACAKAQRYLDAYIGGELTAESNHDVVTHLEACPACHAEMETRVRLRTAVRQAVRNSEPAPDYLATRIGAQLRERQSGPRWFSAAWALPVAAAVGGLALGVVLWRGANQPVNELRALSEPEQDSAVARLVSAVPEFLRAGFGDHLHCSVARGKWAPEAELTPQSRLDGGWSQLPALVRKLVPEKYTVVAAHRCRYHGKKFVHLAYEGEGRLMSLSILRKADADVITPDALRQQSSAAVSHYQVTAFETNDYIVYFSSNLPGSGNSQLAQSLTQPVREFLNALKS